MFLEAARLHRDVGSELREMLLIEQALEVWPPLMQSLPNRATATNVSTVTRLLCVLAAMQQGDLLAQLEGRDFDMEGSSFCVSTAMCQERGVLELDIVFTYLSNKRAQESSQCIT